MVGAGALQLGQPSRDLQVLLGQIVEVLVRFVAGLPGDRSYNIILKSRRVVLACSAGAVPSAREAWVALLFKASIVSPPSS